MDEHTLARLEFAKVLDRIAAGAMLSMGAQAARDMRPMTDLAPIRTRSERIAEGAAVLAGGNDFAVERFEDPQPAFDRAAIEDSALAPAELQTVAAVLRNARDLQKVFKRIRDTAPTLAKLSYDLAPAPELLEAIEKAILPDGTVSDDASPDLRRIRRELKELQDRLRHRLEALVQSADLKAYLTGDYITQRNGRYVIPILATQVGQVPGIVHDRSDTGHTAFVEPQFVVAMGNELRALASDEEREVQRILRELTSLVRGYLYSLRVTAKTLVEFDLVRAAARYARTHEMTRPAFAEDGVLKIIGGRHPILEDSLTPGGHKVVPLDFEIGARVRTIAITGANAGGKTVSLKTIGILCLMAQTGLLVPAREGSTFPVLERVLVDIGDEQSIEANLSTFSGHIRHINEVLPASGPRSLVLLDEIGAGTDPVEGGALACAILKALHDRGALTVVTTHLGQVKGFVHEQEGMENAAVQFDPETLTPTYQLVIGLPGASHALTIARRFGLPEEVLATAEKLVDSRAIEMEGLLARLTESLRKAEADAETARRERAEAEEARKNLAERLEEAKRERKEALRKAVEEARGLVDNTRREMERAIEEARRAGADAAAAKQLRRKVEEKRDSFRKKAGQLAPKPRPAIPLASLLVGQRVWIETMKRHGTVSRIDERRGKVTVDAGGLSIEVDASAVCQPDAESPAPPATQGRTVVARPAAVAPELNLIGQHVEEAVRNLERYLNEACLAGLGNVRIIHGFGTGALRDAIHAMLKKHPLIASFHYGEKHEGGRGATIAVLK
jgi:DNA mismatch repair protein MutS2